MRRLKTKATVGPESNSKERSNPSTSVKDGSTTRGQHSMIDNEMVQLLSRSREILGEMLPIIIDKSDGEILSGRHRKEAGWKRVTEMDVRDLAEKKGLPKTIMKELSIFYFPIDLLTIGILAATVVFVTPFFVRSVWKTWGSLSKWRKAFLRFSLITNIESVAFETENPQERLLAALTSYNPDYEEILNGSWEDEAGESRYIRDIPEIKGIFKNVSVKGKKRTVTFDVLIGGPAFPEKSKGALSQVKESFSKEIQITVGRIMQGELSIEDYKQFSEDVKQLLSSRRRKDCPVGRALLVSNVNPSDELIRYAENRRNWPKYHFSQVPIDLIVQEEKGYRVTLAN